MVPKRIINTNKDTRDDIYPFYSFGHSIIVICDLCLRARAHTTTNIIITFIAHFIGFGRTCDNILWLLMFPFVHSHFRSCLTHIYIIIRLVFYCFIPFFSSSLSASWFFSEKFHSSLSLCVLRIDAFIQHTE